MRVLLILLLVLFVDVQAVSARKRRETKVTSEGNHTVNEATKGKIFTLKDLRANAPLAIVLKSKSSDDKGIDTKLDSPVNVTITDDHDQKVECSVSRMNQLCLLEKVKSERATKVEYSPPVTQIDLQDPALRRPVRRLPIGVLECRLRREAIAPAGDLQRGQGQQHRADPVQRLLNRQSERQTQDL